MARSGRRASSAALTHAAGGLVWRTGRREARLAVIHRPKRDDWSLPKGKLEPGEDFTTAALREVEEETGLAASLRGFAGCTVSEGRRGTKVVLYWHMRVEGPARFVPNEEADQLEWLTPKEALARLDDDAERRLLAKVGRTVRGARPPEGLLAAWGGALRVRRRGGRRRFLAGVLAAACA